MKKIRALTLHANQYSSSNVLKSFYSDPSPLKLLYCKSCLSMRLLMRCIVYLHINCEGDARTYLVSRDKSISEVYGLVNAAIEANATTVAFQMRKDLDLSSLISKLLLAGIQVMITVAPPLDDSVECDASYLFRQLDHLEDVNVYAFDRFHSDALWYLGHRDPGSPVRA